MLPSQSHWYITVVQCLLRSIVVHCTVELIPAAAQVQQGQSAAAAGGGDLQAQWAEYYRQCGYFYGGHQQQGGAAGPTGQPPNAGGTNAGPAGPIGSGENPGGGGERKVSRLSL